MEDVNIFEVEVDVSNCEKLYDYGHAEFHHRPADGQWDLNIFNNRQSHTNVSQDDENTMVSVDKMDKIMKRSGAMEKEKKEDKGNDKNEAKWSELDFVHPDQKLPKRVLPVFRPGDIVKGKVILETKKPIEAQKFEITCHGQARTLVRVYHKHGYSDVVGKDDYIKEKRLVWEKSEDATDDCSDTFALLSVSEREGPILNRSKLIPTGKHTFPFEFALPSECPGSTPQLIPSSWSDYAYVIYRIKAKIDSGKKLTRDLVSYKGLWIDQKMDIASNPEDMMPFSLDETLDTGIAFWKGGSVVCTAKLPRRAYIRNEEIPLTLEIENHASNNIDGITSQVLLRGKSRTGTSRFSLTHSINIKGKKTKAESVPAGQSKVIQMKVPLDFSEAAIDSNLAPAGTLSDCDLIDVKYDLSVKVKRSGLHRNIEMAIPITIGTVNSSAIGAPGRGLYPTLQ